MKNSRRLFSDIILKAFLQVRDGWSAEYVVCDPELNTHYIAACRSLGAIEKSESLLNVQLLNLRKQGGLSAHPSTKRKSPGDSSIHKAVENAVRFLERQFKTNVDNIVCDTRMREEFDALIQLLMPGCAILEARYAALTLRKKSALKPEVIGRIIESIGGAISPILGLKVVDLPTDPAVYLFFDQENTLYAGKADNLRQRVEEHLSTWTARDLLAQIQQHRRAPVFLVTHILKADIPAQSLGAYETEIIRSRNPSHNRAGKSKK